jgi:alpha-L-arabinofuranosidase
VFAGEYACHTKGDHQNTATGMNTFEASLCEAAFMTGLERNADVVHMATYAPLFSHVEGWQWRPDLIWMDNLTTVRTPNYYVQQLYGQNPGTNVLSLTEGGKPVTGQDGLCASAVYDKPSGDYILKVANTNATERTIEVTFKGVKSLGEGIVTSIHDGNPDAFNSLSNKNNVTPKTSKVSADGNILRVTIPAKTFSVYRF